MCEVSVIIPTHNRARLVCKAIESALVQTFRNFEVIVIDDGSTDNTADRLAGYGARIKYRHQTQRGRSAARNHGIIIANGRYCAFLDSDDMWLPDTLERQIAELELHPDFGLVHGAVEVIDADGNPMTEVTRVFQAGLALQRAKGETYEELLLHHAMYTSTTMIPRQTFDVVGLYDPALDPREDLDLYLRIALRFGIGSVGGGPLCLYRMDRDDLVKPPNLAQVYIKVHAKHLLLLDLIDWKGPAWKRKAVRNLHIALAGDHYAGGDRKTARSHLAGAFRLAPKGAVMEPTFSGLALRTALPPFMVERLRRMRALSRNGSPAPSGGQPQVDDSAEEQQELARLCR